MHHFVFTFVTVPETVGLDYDDDDDDEQDLSVYHR